MIDSVSFNSKPSHEQLYLLAIGYLHSSRTLCVDIGTNCNRQSWPHASVVYFLIHHATELFLKACILSCRPSGEKLHHDVGKLKARYLELFSKEDCDFHTPWGRQLTDIEKELGFMVFEGVDRVPDQKFRYSLDKQGKSSQSISSFAPGYFLNYVEYLETRWNRVWSSRVTDSGG